MFARWARLPLRRCLHTRVPPSSVQNTPFNRLALVLGVSTAAATYVTWRLAANDYRIALDSPQSGKVSGSKPAPRAGGTTSLTQQEPEAAPASPSDGPSSSTSSSTMTTTTTPTPTPTNGIKGDQSTEPSDKTTTSQEEEGQGDDAASEPNGSNGGAFNPETGEINWDCPCLGGMAHGPCGPQFREAFSCFVFSEAEPKGMDCVEKFKAMQDCFRAHPDVYADEIADDEEENVPASGEESSASQGVEEKDLPIQPRPEIPPDNTPGSPTSTAS